MKNNNGFENLSRSQVREKDLHLCKKTGNFSLKVDENSDMEIDNGFLKATRTTIILPDSISSTCSRVIIEGQA